MPLEQEKLSYQQGPTLKGKMSGSKKILLIVGGGILVIFVLAVLGYFFLLPSREPSIPPGTKAAATKRKLSQTKPLVSPQKPAARERKEITAPVLKERDEEKTSPQPEKAPPSLTDQEVKEVSSATAEETSVSPAPPARPEGTYSIHVGSFKVKENAFDLRDSLQKKGYPVRCFLLTIPGKGEWYRVEVGYYSVLEDAQQALSKLESEEKLTELSLIGP